MANRSAGRWLRGLAVVAAAVPITVAALPARLVGEEPGPATAVARPLQTAAVSASPAANLAIGPRLRPTAPPAVREFDVVATGDLLIHSPIYRRALLHGGGDGYDFRPLFANIRPIVRRAALAICHVETPLGPGPPATYPIFNTPPELADAIAWTGWDACSTASNHSVDGGQAGIDSTVAALEAAGIAHTGSFRTQREARRIPIVEVRGVRIAFLAYATWTNGIPLPNAWSVNLISVPKIERDARRARRLGADIVIVNLHWGTEYVHEPDAHQEAMAEDLLGRGIVDAIIGQHAHVVQPIGRIAGRYVVFGEGNLISSQTGDRQDGLIAVLHVRAEGKEARITGVDYVPTWVRHPDHIVEPVGRALRRLIAAGEGNGWLAAALRASYLRTVAAVGSGRRIKPLPASLP
ncbi:MAG: CapA family protein [Actinomycetota bacterium]